MQSPAFNAQFNRLLNGLVVEVAAYENLKLLCWNRSHRARFIAAEDALHLYERNWRQVDHQRLQPAERELIDRLAAQFGNGVLNV